MSEEVLLIQMLQKALDVEQKGAKTYLDYSRRMNDNAVQRLFRRLSEEELEHAALVKKLIGRAKNPVGWQWDDSDTEKYATINLVVVGQFPGIDVFETMPFDSLDPGADILEALKYSFEQEKAQFEYYKNMVDDFDEPVAQNIVRTMARQEKDHARALAEEYNRLLSRRR